MPIPPSRAMAIAIRASVTVSIAAETIGMFSSMLRDSREFVVASFGKDVRFRRDQQYVVECQTRADDLLLENLHASSSS